MEVQLEINSNFTKINQFEAVAGANISIVIQTNCILSPQNITDLRSS